MHKHQVLLVLISLLVRRPLEKDVVDNYWYRVRFKDSVSFFLGTFSIKTETKNSHHGDWNLQILPSG